MQTVQNIRDQFLEKFLNKEFVGNTVEIIGATFLADEPVIFGEINHDWNQRELEWYESISRNVNDIEGNIPTIWKRVATPDGRINSNYGWCIWSEENGSQYKHVLEKLKLDRNSRQGEMVYVRPNIHSEWNKDGMSDFICTIANMFFIRDNRLVSHYIFRSNDSVHGYKGDVFWASEVQRRLAKDLNVEVGDLIWTGSSQHIYDRHYYLIDHYAKTGEISILKEKYAELYPDSEYL